MVQKLSEPKTAGLKPTEIEHVDRVKCFIRRQIEQRFSDLRDRALSGNVAAQSDCFGLSKIHERANQLYDLSVTWLQDSRSVAIGSTVPTRLIVTSHCG